MMMTTADEPRFEVEINYTKSVIQSIVKEQIKGFAVFVASLWVGVVGFLFFCTELRTLPIQSYFLHPAGQCIIVTVLGCLIVPILLQFLVLKQSLPKQFDKIGHQLKLDLTVKFFEACWSNHEAKGELPWSLFTVAKRTKRFLIVFYGSTAFYLPTDQLPPEAQAFILKKLTEYNVPIKD